jgi:alpha-L-fucosidase 2
VKACRRIVLLLAALGCAPLHAAVPLVLHYDAPANDWEREALPIGNGALGAMIFGGVATERLQLNEKTLWTGGPRSASGYDFGIPEKSLAKEVAAVAEEIERTGKMSPENVAQRLGRKARGYGDYQSAGDLLLEFTGSVGTVSGYRRELDIDHAVAHIAFTHDGVSYRREYFASYPDGVIVAKLTADKPASIGVRVRLAIPDNRTATTTVSGGRITTSGALRDNELAYESGVQVIATGGRRDDGIDAIRIAGADSVVIVLTMGTNYRNRYPDYRGLAPHRAIEQRLDAATKRGYDALLERHTADYRALFGRVTLDLGQQSLETPTNELVSSYGHDATRDRTLEALYFQYGRYLLIASSRAGSLPANLQGVWNQSATPPWNGDYHVNINLQMNYWLAESTNLAETAAPFFDFVDALVAPGTRSARQIVGARGWTVFLNTNAFGFAGVIDWPTAFWQPEAGAWLAQHYYEHYRYSQDQKFLRARAWPIMKGAAQFWLDALRLDPHDHRLVVSPSYSPEHGDFTAGAAMSQQIVFDLFTSVIEAAPLVGDRRFGDEVNAALMHLDPGLRIGSWDQLQEWRADLDDRKDEHRHASHLFALHPGRELSPEQSPALARAARVALDARGDGGTGWSKAWKINFWARLEDGTRAYQLLGEQLRASTLPNLFDTHPPFQIDGNFGATAGMAEMLLQSEDGIVHLLPALPAAWPDGEVRGLRARGAVTVDLTWRGGRLEAATLTTQRGADISIRMNDFRRNYSLVDKNGTTVRTIAKGDALSFPARAGATYVLKRER